MGSKLQDRFKIGIGIEKWLWDFSGFKIKIKIGTTGV
jgi:hypothetical protein